MFKLLVQGLGGLCGPLLRLRYFQNRKAPYHSDDVRAHLRLHLFQGKKGIGGPPRRRREFLSVQKCSAGCEYALDLAAPSSQSSDRPLELQDLGMAYVSGPMHFGNYLSLLFCSGLALFWRSPTDALCAPSPAGVLLLRAHHIHDCRLR